VKSERVSRLLIACVLVGVTFLLSGCVDLTAGQVNVTRTGSIMGIIVDSDGQSILGVDITVGSRTDTTDNNGAYSLENLQIGQYVLIAKKVGYKDVRRNIIIAEGNEVIDDITMERDGESGGDTGYTPPVGNKPIDDEGHALHGFTPIGWNHWTDNSYPIYFNNVAYKDNGTVILLGVEYETSIEISPQNLISCFNPPQGSVFMSVERGKMQRGKNTIIFEIGKAELAEISIDQTLFQGITVMFSPLGGDLNRSLLDFAINQLPF